VNQLDELLAMVPMDQVAAQLGVGTDEAAAATRSALGALLGGMSANAADPGGEASLVDALRQHGQELDDGVDLDKLDVDDGGRIVDHVFGESRDEVLSRLGGANGQQAAGGLGGGLMAKLLPMLAPLVMAWLAKNMGGLLGGGAEATPAPSSGGATPSNNPSVRDILDDVLGPGGRPRQDGGATPSNAEPEQEQGGGLPDLGGLGDILGDLLGNGRKG
jgi:hypothetical protein